MLCTLKFKKGFTFSIKMDLSNICCRVSDTEPRISALPLCWNDFNQEFIRSLFAHLECWIDRHKDGTLSAHKHSLTITEVEVWVLA